MYACVYCMYICICVYDVCVWVYMYACHMSATLNYLKWHKLLPNLTELA